MTQQVRYKEFILDQFQIDAIKSVEQNHSVVVSAATGTGKTLIADYIIDKSIKENKKVIYTAPIKALSNQKYKEFTQSYGQDKIGLITGDIVINQFADILIMTTEIYRNMLLAKDPIIDDIAYVVFDEIHYINDIERGTVWEESIIFSPEHVRFLCLSATIPNADEFASWIQTTLHHKVDVIRYMKRAVPLKHYVFDVEAGITDAKKLKQILQTDKFNNYDRIYAKRRRGEFGQKKKKQKSASHVDLIKEITAQNAIPAIFFVFSRKACEEKAEELSKKTDFTSAKQKKEIVEILNKYIRSDLNIMKSVQLVRRIAPRGIGVHHAGILPGIKSAMEELFAKGLLSVLYATETFAVGINMPAKTVCFNSLEKFDGLSFRYMNSKEYFQMAGRAGRRGIDKFGQAIALIDRGHVDIDKIINITTGDTEPIKSQFNLSYNTVLNLIGSHTQEEIDIILKKNFDYYQKKQSNKQVRIMTSYKNKVQILKKRGFLTENMELTQKGYFAKFIYSNELLVTDLFINYPNWKLKEIVLLLAAIEYEPRNQERFFKRSENLYTPILKRLSPDINMMKKINKIHLKKLSKLVDLWCTSDDVKFTELTKICTLAEGDIIRLFRRVIDVIRQVLKASDDYDLKDTLLDAIKRIDRDVMRPEF